MQFRVTEVDASDKKWAVTALGGALQGKQVATVEGVTLKNVTLVSNGMLGTVEAVWGAVLSDDAYNDIQTVLALGLNRGFRAKGAEHEVVFDGHQWTNLYGDRHVLVSARRAVILGNNVFATLF